MTNVDYLFLLLECRLQKKPLDTNASLKYAEVTTIFLWYGILREYFRVSTTQFCVNKAEWDLISNWTRRHLLAHFHKYTKVWWFWPSSTNQRCCWSRWVRPRTSLCWTEEYYAAIYTSENKFGKGILCALRFKTVWEIIQCYLTSNGYKGFGPADLRFYTIKVF